MNIANHPAATTAHKLTRGRALVLHGPQGCGKTTMAREIAAAHGSYAEVDATVLDEPLRLGAVLDGEPDTLVVEGAPASMEGMQRIKQLLTSPTAIAQRKGQHPKQVRSPNLIICTDAANPLVLDAEDRRFEVVWLG